MTGLARFVLRHRLLVVVAWVAALVAGMAMSQKAIDRLTFDFSLPGQPGFETEQQLVKLYGNGPDEGTAVIAVSVPSGTVADRRQQVDGIFRGLQQQFPQYRIVWGGNTGNVGFTTDDQRTAYGIVDGARLTSFTAPPPHRAVKPYLEQQARATGLTVRTTGYFELAEGGGAEGSEPPSVLGETLLGAAGALVVLVFVFASFLALVPLLVAAVSILTTFLCLLGLTYLTDVSFIVQFLVALVGLGVGHRLLAARGQPVARGAGAWAGQR